MVLSEIEQQRAFREAREIMKLGEKWQELMPGEKRPNFERAAKEVLRRALGHRVVKNEEALDIKEGGLMHEHAPARRTSSSAGRPATGPAARGGRHGRPARL